MVNLIIVLIAVVLSIMITKYDFRNLEIRCKNGMSSRVDEWFLKCAVFMFYLIGIFFWLNLIVEHVRITIK